MKADAVPAAPDPERGRSVRVYVHLNRKADVIDYGQRFEKGLEPDRTPYGFHFGNEFGCDVRFSEPAPAGEIRVMLAKIAFRLLGFDPEHAWRNRRRIAECDCIWAMLERDVFGVSILMALGLAPRRPIITSLIWLPNNWLGLSSLRRWWLLFLTRYISLALVQSESNLARMREILPQLPVRLLHFGVSHEWFRPITRRTGEKGRLHLVSVGVDASRDWDVLLAAFGNDPHFRLTIVCPWFDPGPHARWRNVECKPFMNPTELKELYRTADYIVVPLRENLYSGITQAIEAALLQVPVLATRTGGIPTYFRDCEMLFVEPGDAAGMRQAVLEQHRAEREKMATRAYHAALEHDYTSRGMMRRYAAFTTEVIEGEMATTCIMPDHTKITGGGGL